MTVENILAARSRCLTLAHFAASCGFAGVPGCHVVPGNFAPVAHRDATAFPLRGDRFLSCGRKDRSADALAVLPGASNV